MLSDSLNDWIEWLKICSLEGCCAETQGSLSAFARYVFCREAKIENKGSMDGIDLPDQAGTEKEHGSACWTYVEERLLNGKHQTGKSYKSYMCDYTLSIDPSLQHPTFRRAFSDQVRNVVRAYIAPDLRENKRNQARGLVSLNSGVGWSESESEVGDFISVYSFEFIPDLSDLTEMERNDFISIADELASEVWEALDRRERIAGLAALNEVSLADTSVLAVAECQKSQLYAARTSANKKANEAISSVDGDEYSLHVLKLFLASTLEKYYFDWMESEKELKALFMEMKG